SVILFRSVEIVSHASFEYNARANIVISSRKVRKRARHCVSDTRRSAGITYARNKSRFLKSEHGVLIHRVVYDLEQVISYLSYRDKVHAFGKNDRLFADEFLNVHR